ncbi:YfbU family protein [Macrococcus lamae]|uniref:YfbU family protein n=1 Tax=Macrococcus lamae TaxID=198484 RepID=A0A4R6BTP4_9STAP|nr:YfbU family protein [Macrococcus lamae]TDM10440.1 hypothetical protein ERX29_07155 [Macrococcus lamae]
MDDRMLRMILFQNCQLLEKLDPNKAELYQQQSRILKEGIIYEYGMIFEELPKDDECIPHEISEEVIEIISMFSHIGNSIKAQQLILPFSHVFLGFNRNDDNEWHHARYTEHYLSAIIDSDERLDLTLYYSMKNKPSCLYHYRHMLKVYSPYKEKTYLSLNELYNILNHYILK